jgi:NADP-dependent 3-hydroxy acid dehydrogenase YdfG
MSALARHIAVVTGGSSGIGKAIALGLAHQDATVCLVGRNLETLQAVAEVAPSVTPRMRCYQADLTLDDELRDLVARLRQECSQIDLLIHSAGVLTNGPLEVAPVEDFDWQYRTNVRAPYLLTQGLLPSLKARQGQIVFINSTVGLNAVAHIGQYAATKHALRAVADSLRAEVNPAGVRVLSVFLGRTATPMQAAVHQMEGRAYRPELLIQPEDVAMLVLNTLRLPRTAEVTDIHLRPMTKSY